MSVQCRDVIKCLETLAPKHLAEEWDNVGLQVGSLSAPIKKVMVALDGSNEVIDEAIEREVDLIITHHPLIFKPMKKILSEDEQGSIITKLIKHDIGLYCAHTNLDIANHGVNDVLAQQLGIEQCKILVQTQEEGYYKLVIFVPEGHEDGLRAAICKAGAGFIGAYSNCTYQGKGTGTFLAHEGCNPFLGEVGEIEYAEEYRLETIVPKAKLKQVLSAMEENHPYEEVAYDLYKLENQGEGCGLGRIGSLAEEITLGEFLTHVSEQLGKKQLTYVGDLDKKIKRVALCGGSGSSFISAAISQGADVYVTGDVKYHEGQLAAQHNLAIVDGGHFNTEKPIVAWLASYLTREIEEIEVITSSVEEDVLKSFNG